MGGESLVGWLSGFWARTGSVAYLEVCDYVKRSGEAFTPGGEAARAPTLHLRPRHLPYNWGKITEKPQSGYSVCQLPVALYNPPLTRHASESCSLQQVSVIRRESVCQWPLHSEISFYNMFWPWMPVTAVPWTKFLQSVVTHHATTVAVWTKFLYLLYTNVYFILNDSFFWVALL